MRKIIILVSAVVVLSVFLYLKNALSPLSIPIESFRLVVSEGESVKNVAETLSKMGVIRNVWFFQKYLSYKEIDKKIGAGEFVITPPYSVVHIAELLTRPGVSEETITILPGWDLDEVVNALAEKLPYFNKKDFIMLAGEPATDYRITHVKPKNDWGGLTILEDRPDWASLEGYLSPNTFRVYKNSTAEEVILRLLVEREKQIDASLWQEVRASGHSFYEVLTMASVLEREVRGELDRRNVADIFWRRYEMNWALQSDATVHYAVRKSGDVFTTAADRAVDSPWNTYKNPGLPLGPICMPGVEAIRAAVNPEKNDYWYFLTDKNGAVRYAKDLAEHNSNKVGAY